MIRFLSLFTLDLRSIAVFRVMFGSIMLFDIVSRIPYAELFLSDYGALSRSDLLAVMDRPWAFSVYMMFGETSQVVFLLLVNACLAILLVFGLWTRFASVACWVMLLSLQHRNPLILNGGDTLFSIYAFWMMFLPLNARWSIDSLLAKREGTAFVLHDGNRYLGVPGAAIILQTVFVYLFTVILKTGSLWASGDVVSYVIRNQSLIKRAALWLQDFESWHVFLSRGTYHWEWFGCLLLFFPFANWVTRSIAIVGYAAMHIGFGVVLDLGIFVPVSIMGWIILAPAQWWDFFGQYRNLLSSLQGRADPFAAVAGYLPFRGGKLIEPKQIAAIMTGLAIIMALVWNLRGLPESNVKKWIPDSVSNTFYVLKLRQKWSMFAPNPSQYSHWFVMEAQFANGDSVDLFVPSVPLSLRRPELFTDRTPDRRWGKFLSNLKRSKYSRLRDDFINYFVTRWNDKVGDNSKIEKVNLLFIRERIGSDGGYYQRELKTLRTVYVEGVPQVVEIQENEAVDRDDEEEDL